jgi:hypothetical protein
LAAISALGSFSDFEQRSHKVRFALWTGPRWRNDIPTPVAQFVAHKLLQASSRKRRNPKDIDFSSIKPKLKSRR